MSKRFSLLWDPLCTDFMEGKPVVDNFIDWTMTNLQLMCHFINSHPSVLQHITDSRVCNSNGRGWASGSFLMLNACATSLEPLDQFAQSSATRHRSHTALTSPYAFRLLVHLQPIKIDYRALLFLGANEKRSVHVYGTKLTEQMDYRGHSCTTMVG